jgi:drug/metabolite transporter superfamily protein YnfA
MWGFGLSKAAIGYVAAALAEIGGCFAFWASARGAAPDRYDLAGACAA